MSDFMDGVEDLKFLKIYDSETEYRSDAGSHNYSKIKDFDSDPLLVWRAKYIERTVSRKTSSEMERGSLVDCLLTNEEEFDSIYAPCSAPLPTPSNLKFVESLLSIQRDPNNPIEDFYEKAYNMSDIKSPKFPKFMENFYGSDTEVYYQERLDCVGKKVIGIDQYEEATRIVGTVKNTKHTKWVFGGDGFSQLPIQFQYMGVKFRALLDRVSINHKAKEITPIDLKVTAQDRFSHSFISLKYYLQQGVYELAVKAWASEAYPDYKVNPFQFYAVDDGGYAEPLLFEVEPPEGYSFLRKFPLGFKMRNGVMDIVENMEWHVKNNEWGMKKEFIDNKGKIKIKL